MEAALVANAPVSTGTERFRAVAVIPRGSDVPDMGGIVLGYPDWKRLVKAARDAGARIAKTKTFATADAASRWIADFCGLANGPREMTDPERPVCLRDGYERVEKPSRQQRMGNWAQADAHLYVEPSSDRAERAVIYGVRPVELFGRAQERYERESWRTTFADISREVQGLAAAGVTTFVTDESQGAAQLGFWAVESLKEQGERLSNVIVATFDGCDRAWAGETAAFASGDFRAALDVADEVSWSVARPSSDDGLFHGDEYKQARAEHEAQLCACARHAVCATRTGAYTIHAEPGEALNLPQAKSALEAAERYRAFTPEDAIAAKSALAAGPEKTARRDAERLDALAACAEKPGFSDALSRMAEKLSPERDSASIGESAAGGAGKRVAAVEASRTAGDIRKAR